MMSSFVLASLLSLALAAPLDTPTGPANGTQACGRGLPKCPSGYLCRELLPGQVADYTFCIIPSVSPAASPAKRQPTTFTTDVSTLSTIAPPADGTQVCGRGLPQCPSGYVCREKLPGQVADYTFCYKDVQSSPVAALEKKAPSTNVNSATLSTATAPANGTQVCGRGLPQCPSGYVCREKLPGQVADYTFCFIAPAAASLEEKAMSTTTSTATRATATPPANGSQHCGRGQPQCPSGYVCREKLPGKVADLTFCYIKGTEPKQDLPVELTTTVPASGPEDGTQACGRGLKQCPAGYSCKEKLPGQVADYTFCYHN